MGFGDIAGSAIDAASSALGGGAAGGGGAKPDKANTTFLRKDPLDEPKDKPPLAVGPNGGDTPPNTAKPPDQIEFVHFGNVHIDTTNHFPHPKFDNEKDKKPAGRAIMFRDALERESLLLFGFVTWAQTSHKELKDSRGAAGAVANAVGSLMGGSGGGDEPSPDSLKSLGNDIQSAGDKINKDPIDYIKVHKCGIDLHQTRSDYRQYCEKKLETFYLKPADSKPTLVSLPSVAGGAKKVFDILFSAFDIYFAIFLHIRHMYEPKIEDACYRFSIDAVKKYQPPTFAMWYPPKKDAPAAAPSSSLPGPLASAENDYNKAKKDVTDEIGTPDDDTPPPGAPVVGEIFAIFGAGPSDPKDKDKEKDKDPAAAGADKKKDSDKIDPADQVVNAAFKDVTGDIPSFLQTVIGKATWINVEFLQAIYMQLCKDGDKAIDLQWVDKTATDMIFSRLVGLLEDHLSFIKGIEDASFGAMGQQVGPKKLINKGEDALKAKIEPFASKVQDLLVSQLGDKLKAIYDDASKNKSVTMEVYLGALPAILAMQVRNTIFPMMYMLFNELFGKGNAALDIALKPVKDLIAKARDVADTAKDKKDRINQAKDKFDKEGLAAGSGGQNVAAYKDIVMGNTPKPTPGGGVGAGSGFPGSSRTTSGTGNKIPGDDPKKAENDRTTKDPWPA